MAKADTLGNNAAAPHKSSASKAAKGGHKDAKPNIFARLGQYFRDVRSEMKRVVWPNLKEVRTSSGVVVVTLVFFIVFTLIVDNVVIQLIKLITTLKAS